MIIKTLSHTGDQVSTLRVAQVNLGKRKAACAELNSRKGHDIVLITEPSTSKRGVVGIEPVNEVFATRNEGARSCIKTSLDAWLVEEFTCNDLVTVAVVLVDKVVYFASVYMDINHNVREGPWVKLVDWCDANGHALIVGMDSNAHSPLWGSEDLNCRGEELEHIVMSRNLMILNRGRTATFVGGVSSTGTIIDVSLVNQEAAPLVEMSSWSVDPTESMSDHRYISFSINIGANKPSLPIRNVKKADWTCFRAKLGELPLDQLALRGTRPEEELEKYVMGLKDNILLALDHACPSSRPPPPKMNRWWNKELEELRRKVRALEKRRKYHPLAKEAYVDARRVYSRAISKAKKDSWRDFCSKADTTRDVARLVRCLEPKPPMRMALFAEGDETLSPCDSLKLLLSTHFPDSTAVGGEPPLLPAMEQDGTGVVQWINSFRVAAALKSFGDYKTAGPDGIQPIVLKNLTAAYIDHLVIAFQYSLAMGIIPTLWRLMRVIFIPKAGKGHYADPKAYRPITLSNFILKTLERCIQWFILEHCITRPLVGQHAYTRGLSTDTALSTFVDEVERAIYRQQHSVAVSLDCTGAFDTVSFDAAEEAMRLLNIPQNIIRWYARVLRNRRVWACVQGIYHAVIPGRGSPQGGVLSPIIWNMVMNTLLKQFSSGPVKAIGYADDVMLVSSGPDAIISGQHIQGALDKVLEWGERRGLTFNPKKTQAVLFTLRKGVQTPILGMGMSGIKFDSTLKYLGVTIQKSLSWDAHISERTGKCRYLLQRTRAIIGQNWGISPEKSIWIHKAIVRPKLCYGSLVWASNISSKARSKLKSVQRLTLLSVLQPLRSTPTLGMEVLLGLIPMDMFAEREAVKARLRTRGLVSVRWDGLGIRRQGHRRVLDEVLDNIIPPNHITDHIPARLNWLELGDVPNPEVTIYTDGSAFETSGGYGWAACSGMHVIEEESGGLENTTAYQAEVMAIAEAAKWAASQSKGYKRFKFISDSQSAISAMKATTINSTVVLEAVGRLQEVTRVGPVQLEWTRGHSNCTGNELADALARLGSNSTQKRRMPWSAQTLKGKINRLFDDRWQDRWTVERTCRNTRSLLPKVDSKRSALGKSGRHKLNLICQAVTGHGLFAGHLAKWRDMESTCKLCEEEVETSAHLWHNCPALEQVRDLSPCDSGPALMERIHRFFSSSQVLSIMARNESQL